MTLRYSNRPVVGPQKQEDWRSRFPANARPIETAPAMGSRPIRVFEPNGHSKWAIHHAGGWKVVEMVLDADGMRRPRMTGDNMTCPVMWASS